MNNDELSQNLTDAINVVETQISNIEAQIELYNNYHEGHEKILKDLFGGCYASSIEEQMEEATV